MSPTMSERAFLESFPEYFLSSVSGLLTSGNLRPTNLGFLLKLSSYSLVSGPSTFCIKYSWSTSESPGKSG